MSEKQSSKSINKEDKFVQHLVIWTFIISGAVIFTLFTGYWATDHLWKSDIDNEYLSAFGDFIGGFIGTLIGLVTIFLVYKTYKSQKEELELSRKLIQKQNFESTFFGLLNLIRENRSIIKIENNKELALIESDVKEIAEKFNKGNQKDVGALKKIINECWYTKKYNHYSSYIQSILNTCYFIKKSWENDNSDTDLYFSILENSLNIHEINLLSFINLIIEDIQDDKNLKDEFSLLKEKINLQNFDPDNITDLLIKIAEAKPQSRMRITSIKRQGAFD